MLPTKGFFKHIDCPYHDRSCGRPYCHFRHRKKLPESDESPTANRSSVPTYKPTPKSELTANKSHIPISYIPDVVRSSSRTSYDIKDRPTYKPTPKSVLSNTLPPQTVTAYTPTPITQLQDEVDPNRLDLDDFATEFELIDEILFDADRQDEAKKSVLAKNKVIAGETHGLAEESSKIENKTNIEKHKERDRSRDRHKHDKGKDKEREHDKSKQKSNKLPKASTSSASQKDPKASSSKSSSSGNKSKGGEHRKDKYSRSSSNSSSGSSSRKHDKTNRKATDGHRARSKDGTSSRSKQNTTPKGEREESAKYTNDSDADIEANDAFNEDPDLDDLMIEDECLKIFNEYKPPEQGQPKPAPPPVAAPQPQEEEDYIQSVGKKRIAYSNAAIAKEDVKPRPTIKRIQSAGMALQSRIRIAHQNQAANEAQNLMQEMRNIKRQIAPPPAAKASSLPKKAKPNGMSQPKAIQPPTPTCLIDDIISGRNTSATASTSKSMRRIAPVSNMLSLQKAKARIDELRRVNASGASKTIAQTVAKGATRAAHVPDMSLANIPDVLNAERSKLPVNVRTRYLCLLADECVKLYVATEEAYARALNEEFKCYERCSALATYRNSAMLAVNRLRKEAQEREAAGLGPLQVGEQAYKKGEAPLEGRRIYDLIKGFLLSEEELVLHGFPREGPMPGRAVVNTEHKQLASEQMEANQRVCSRCHKTYIINRDGFPLFEEECCYHPLRKRTIRGEQTYLCCKSSEDTGCVMSNTHVSEVSADRELEGFQSTFESDIADDPRNHAVYALDCEMCYTTKGLELTRVTVVDVNLKTVYESLVKPFNPIIDYNTRFSGITQEQMDKTSTSILQIQANILHLCTAKTILIGHSLESDMKALKIIHNSIVDTSVMFPHKFGLPHKRALRALASDYLKKIIQNDVAGHDSAEDALAAMELVIWKVKEDLKVKGIKH